VISISLFAVVMLLYLQLWQNSYYLRRYWWLVAEKTQQLDFLSTAHGITKNMLLKCQPPSIQYNILLYKYELLKLFLLNIWRL